MLSDSPPERNLDWSNSGIEGSRKFIVKVWNYFNRIKLNEMDIKKGLTKEQTERVVLENSTIIKIIESNNYKKIIIVPDRVVNLVI